MPSAGLTNVHPLSLGVGQNIAICASHADTLDYIENAIHTVRSIQPTRFNYDGAKLLMSTYQITGIIYIHIGMRERERERERELLPSQSAYWVHYQKSDPGWDHYYVGCLGQTRVSLPE